MPNTVPTATLAFVPSGDAGTAATLNLMVKLARTWKKDPGIWKLTRELLQSVPPHDSRAEIERLFHWVKQTIRYTQDVRGIETLATPKVTLEARAGDCDDMAVLLAVLLESAGHTTRFVALSFDTDPYSHVITETRLGVSWIALDPTVPRATVGWRPTDAARELVRHV